MFPSERTDTLPVVSGKHVVAGSVMTSVRESRNAHVDCDVVVLHDSPPRSRTSDEQLMAWLFA